MRKGGGRHFYILHLLCTASYRTFPGSIGYNHVRSGARSRAFADEWNDALLQFKQLQKHLIFSYFIN